MTEPMSSGVFRFSPFCVAILTVLSGCSTVQEAPRVESAPPRKVGIGWDRTDWRVCEGEGCLAPTPKTITVATPMPVVGPTPVVPREPAVPRLEKKPAAATKAQEESTVAPKRPSIVVPFTFASARLNGASIEIIKRAARAAEPGDAIHIEGRTDNVGTQPLNDRLAWRRANHVAERLRQMGLKNRIEIQASGLCCYAAANDTEEGRAINRRAEIKFSTTKAKE